MVELTARCMPRAFPLLFTFGARPDAKDSTKTIANLGQGGLSLPDRSYYLNTDAKSVETRAPVRGAHGEHVPTGRRLGRRRRGEGETGARFRNAAGARIRIDRVAMRDPNKTYNIMTRKELRPLPRTSIGTPISS